MNRTKALFIYTVLIVLVIPPLFPNLVLTFFAPFLMFAFYHNNKVVCLWLALICGFMIDLLSAQTRLGVTALNYCLTVVLFYSQKRHFFEDRLSTLSLMTFIFVFTSTLIQAVLLYAFGQGILLSWEWVKSDLIWMPLIDALYAAIAFTLPSLFFPKIPTRRTVLFSVKTHLGRGT